MERTYKLGIKTVSITSTIKPMQLRKRAQKIPPEVEMKKGMPDPILEGYYGKSFYNETAVNAQQYSSV